MKLWTLSGAALSGIVIGSAAFIFFPQQKVFILVIVGVLSALSGAVLNHIVHTRGMSRRKNGSHLFAGKIVPEQIQEHFLFNALQQISLTILSDVDKAGQCVEDLAQFLRLVLEMGKSEVVILAQELRSVDYYVKIEKERLGERLNIVRQVDPQCLEVPIPCFTILPLVENCILHGVESSPETVTIFILINLIDAGLQIEVSDTGTGLESAQMTETMKTGSMLTYVRQRLKAKYGKKARMEFEALAPSGFRVVLTLPHAKM
jgi:LytS/YehU family sensor histidine kinase